MIGLIDYLRLLERDDLCASLREFQPINGNGLRGGLTSIADHVAGEGLDELDSPAVHCHEESLQDEDGRRLGFLERSCGFVASRV